jgi:hypothetical protein
MPSDWLGILVSIRYLLVDAFYFACLNAFGTDFSFLYFSVDTSCDLLYVRRKGTVGNAV